MNVKQQGKDQLGHYMHTTSFKSKLAQVSRKI